MPIAVIKFTLPEEQDEHIIAVHSMAWALVAWDMDNYLRNELKYNDAGKDIENVRDKLHEILSDHGVNLEMIT